MGRKVTIYDVAERAGVSASTVSRVLNQSENVSDDTRVRVREAIEALGFHPSWVAQRLGFSKQSTTSSSPLEREQRKRPEGVLGAETEQGKGGVCFEGNWTPAERNRVRGAIAETMAPATCDGPDNVWICTSSEIAGRKVYIVFPLSDGIRPLRGFSVSEIVDGIYDIAD